MPELGYSVIAGGYSNGAIGDMFDSFSQGIFSSKFAVDGVLDGLDLLPVLM